MEFSNANMKAIPKIRQLREKLGMTQLELSRLVGVTETSIQNWERSRTGVEQIQRVINLCNALKCSPEDLIEYVLMSQSEVDAETTKSNVGHGEKRNTINQKLSRT
jgi:transcriptional regulator with XRE-family HTH domain